MGDLVEKAIHAVLLPHTTKDGITILTVENEQQGIEVASTILVTLTDRNTALFLSGGKTPFPLYKYLIKRNFLSGAIGMIDERYGEKLHEESNELMIQKTGLLLYLQEQNIPFWQVLQGLSQEATRQAYEKIVMSLFHTFSKKIGILGIGSDGHTAGIAPNRPDFTNPLFQESKNLVGAFDDQHGPFHKRITLTFAALEQLDLLLVLIFGSSKQNALEKVFEKGLEEDVPGRFYTRKGIAQKTLFITDQKII